LSKKFQDERIFSYLWSFILTFAGFDGTYPKLGRFSCREKEMNPFQEQYLMRKHLLVAGIAVAALIPTLAMAQETCEQRSANRTAGTVVGAVAGALLGSAVAGHGEKGTGAAIGGVGGAIAGNQLSRGDRDCTHAYGYYDNGGRWHANTTVATGYYDNDRRWHANDTRAAATGYYDRSGNWVDGQPSGYYDSRGSWVANAATGYGRNASTYETRSNTWDIDAQIARIDDRIQRGRNDGTLSRRETRGATNTLNDIRREERNEMRDGRLSYNEQTKLQGRLEGLSNQVRMDRMDRNDRSD
jgi:hypothetical protein